MADAMPLQVPRHGKGKPHQKTVKSFAQPFRLDWNPLLKILSEKDR
jgi:hypothetical protein